MNIEAYKAKQAPSSRISLTAANLNHAARSEELKLAVFPCRGCAWSITALGAAAAAGLGVNAWVLAALVPKMNFFFFKRRGWVKRIPSVQWLR